jgi:hypothetical protein
MSHQPLVEYFHKINQPPTVKGLMMFDNFKASMQAAREKFASMLVKPTTAAVPDELENEDYWSFEMYSGTWEDFDGEQQPSRHTVLSGPNEGTWMGLLDTILDAMSAHYGYNIKEQVYYSVKFPMNGICEYTDEPFDGYGRCLNDEILQQLLLAYPEAYDSHVPDFNLTKTSTK